MIRTSDIFKAAYLKVISYDCRVEIGKPENGRIVFKIYGVGIEESEGFYRNGWAIVAVADYKMAFCELLNRSGQSIRPKTDKPLKEAP